MKRNGFYEELTERLPIPEASNKIWQVFREAGEPRQDHGDNPQQCGVPALSPATSVASVLDNFMTRYARNSNGPLRSACEYERVFDRLVKPCIGKHGIHAVRRSHIIEMLDKIEDMNGPVMADRTLAYLRKALNWYAVRDDRFTSPIVRGMARTKPKERARSRVLSDQEIRLIWPILDKSGIFGALVKMLLLTGQRRDEVACMKYNEVDKDGMWTIPADRYKTKRANFVPLSRAALTLVEAQSRMDNCDYVFPSRVRTPFSAFGKNKSALDMSIHSAMQEWASEGVKVATLPNWTLHDLRRTGKTLMVRIGVRPDISERVLGHAIAGVEGTYDRHSYADEKRDALEKLATKIEQIVNPLASIAP